MPTCIIPARSGSKRIPKKNIKLFAGKPIIAWSIEAAISSSLFDRVIVSTDDDNIALISRTYGAEVPFFRPPSLSGDYTSTREVILHAIKQLNIDGNEEYCLCCLYATAPLISFADLRNAFDLYLTFNGSNNIFSASSYPYPPQRALLKDSNSTTRPLFPQAFFSRTQDLQDCFHDAGQYYFASVKSWLSNTNFFTLSSPHFIERWRAIDIDTYEDWRHAEYMHKMLKDSFNHA